MAKEVSTIACNHASGEYHTSHASVKVSQASHLEADSSRGCALKHRAPVPFPSQELGRTDCICEVSVDSRLLLTVSSKDVISVVGFVML